MREPDDLYKITERYGYPEATPPEIDYLPSQVTFPARIGIIGCGAETYQFLTAYLRAGFEVVAFSDPNLANAQKVRDTFYPQAKIYDDYRFIVDDSAINFVDISAGPGGGVKALKLCIMAGKHVLCQKYILDDLDVGLELVDLAREYDVKVAVNHDARWAPGWRYATKLVQEGYIGTVNSFDAHAIWNHNWVRGSPLDDDDLNVLRNFAYHWYDIVNAVMHNARALSVSAIVAKSKSQAAKSPLLSRTHILFPNAVASVNLDGDGVVFGIDSSTIVGDEGIVFIKGHDRHEQSLWCISKGKVYCPELKGDWLPGGFHGAMAELIKAVEDDREPENSGENVLESAAICFAALASVREKRHIAPWDETARKIR